MGGQSQPSRAQQQAEAQSQQEAQLLQQQQDAAKKKRETLRISLARSRLGGEATGDQQGQTSETLG